MSSIASIIEQQRFFFDSNATKSIDFRIAQLKKLKAAIQQKEQALHEAIYADFKKSAFENYLSELALIYVEIDTAVKKLHRWAKPRRVKTNMVSLPSKSYILPEPLGICLVIAPWNYPIQLSFTPVVAALAAGNTVVVKPSELCPQCSKVISTIINECFDTNYCYAIEGGVEVTTEILQHKFDKIFFTGSVAVGKIVYEAAAKHLTPVVLELGGKSPAFVTESADLKMAVKRLVWAKFLNAGQTCIAPDYILVHESVEKEFLELVKKEIDKAEYAIDKENYVQIINEKNVDRFVQLIDASKVYVGGVIDRGNRYIEPTVLKDIDFHDPVMEEEIFGPILPVISYASLDAAIIRVKARPKPLACYIFTRSGQQKDKLLTQLSFGGGAVNDAVMHISNNYLPFGGVGDSGMGNYHGQFGFDNFSHLKAILERPNWIEPNLKYHPHTPKKLSLIKLLIGQRGKHT